MIKVLGLALYGPLAASTRYRLKQYVNGLKSYGIDLQIRHLLGDDYLRIRFAGGSMPFKILIRSVFSRLEHLSNQDNYDCAILHCELIPLMPGMLERGLIRKPYIYDFDDAFYLKYQRGWLGIAGPLLQNKFDTIIAGANTVTAGNAVLADYAKLHNPNTIFFPTVVNTQRYVPQIKNRGGKVFTIGWIGSPSTAKYLKEIIVPLSTIGQEGAVKFVVIGGKAPHIPNVTVIEIEWKEETELELINSFDIGVMPLTDDEWTRGKCAFKLIQYMSCAVPVVASPVGANIEVVGVSSGLLASTQQDWVDALRKLRDQPNIRKELGKAGRDRVLECYSLHKNLPVLANLISNLAKKSSL